MLIRITYCLLISFLLGFLVATTLIPKPHVDTTPVPHIEHTYSVAEMIVREAEKHGINPAAAIKIANCESKLDPNAKNKYSSAKGVYQFIDSTWANYCEGDVLDPSDNIVCFMELYPIHPSWWQCKQ